MSKVFRIVVTDILGNRIVSVPQKDYPYLESRISEMTQFSVEHMRTLGAGNTAFLLSPCTTHFNTKHIVSISITEEETE